MPIPNSYFSSGSITFSTGSDDFRANVISDLNRLWDQSPSARSMIESYIESGNVINIGFSSVSNYVSYSDEIIYLAPSVHVEVLDQNLNNFIRDNAVVLAHELSHLILGTDDPRDETGH